MGSVMTASFDNRVGAPFTIRPARFGSQVLLSCRPSKRASSQDTTRVTKEQEREPENERTLTVPR